MDLLCEKVLEIKADLQQQVDSHHTWKIMRHQPQTGAPQKRYQNPQQRQQRPRPQRQQNSNWECTGCKGRNIHFPVDCPAKNVTC